MRVATDIGGTFTDLVYYDPENPSNGFRVAKTDTTPPHVEKGVLNVLAKENVPMREVTFLAHGTTIVINTITERKGVKTGLITTKGFRDVLEIGRANRPDLYNLMYEKPKPFIRRSLRREISERMSFLGQIMEPIKLEELEAIIADFRTAGIQAIAICFLHSYANPVHEIAAMDEIRRLWPDVTITASHQIIREWREYERTSTTVLSAMVQPIVENYLDRLAESLRSKGFSGKLYIMRSNGGIDTVPSVRAKPITMLESGPASGVLGTAALGELIGERNLIAYDVGGTTAKCSLIDNGRVRITTKVMIEKSRTTAGYPILAPCIDLVEIGNGGGSIARVDEFGKLHVGPQSAGADPGPVGYGRGGNEPTTTDAHLMTGRIDPNNFHGGEFVADMQAVRAAFAKLGYALGITPEEAARGVIRIANNNMINALKLVSLNRGFDPRDFTLVAFGGGGGMHGAAVARELGIQKVIVPINSAVFSAWGMLLSDLRRDYIVTHLMTFDHAAAEKVDQTFSEIEAQALAEFVADDVSTERVIFERFADMRYLGQEHTVKVALPSGEITAEKIGAISSTFHTLFEREYSYRLGNPIELVGMHVVAFGRIEKPTLPQLAAAGRTLEAALMHHRAVDFDVDGIHDTPVYDRRLLEPDMSASGPAIIEEPDSVVIVWPGQAFNVDIYGNIIISIGSGVEA